MAAILDIGSNSGSTTSGCATTIEPSTNSSEPRCTLEFRGVQAIVDACGQDARNPKWTIARQLREENEVHTAHTRGVTARPALSGSADDGNADKNQTPPSRWWQRWPLRGGEREEEVSETFRVDMPDAAGQTEFGFES